MVVVVPVDAEDDKAEDVGEKDRHERFKRVDVGPFGDVKLEHHDGDEDGDHPIAERLQPPFFTA